MNKQYRIVWQEATQQWVVVSELAQSHGSSTSVVGGTLRSVLLAFVLTPMAWAVAPVPTQLPTGGQVVAGQVAISQSAAVMNVDQTSQRAAIDWQSFNVGSAAQVNFNQPNSSSVTLNRVLDNNPSQIFGRITAPGQVFLVNPAGAYFAPSASVEVGGLMATTHSLSNEDFMAGRNTLVRNGATGRIVNEGQLKASFGGYIALLAPEVRNNGVVVAQMGTVALAAGEAYTLQFDGKGLLSNVVVTPATMKALVENGNAVQAPGGLIILSAQAASRLQGGIVNNTGSLQASGLVKEGGRILLRASDQISHSGSMQADAAPGSAGQGGHITLIADLNNPESVTRVSGSISAKGGVLGGDGGFIETSASHLGVSETAKISTAAPNGKGGEWLLDPANVEITSTDLDATYNAGTYAPNSNVSSSTTVMASTIVGALNLGTSVTVTTTNAGAAGSGAGNITVSSPIAKTSITPALLTLTADSNIIVNAAISSSSSVLNVTLNANGGNISGNASGAISTNGGLLTLNTASGSGILAGVISGGSSSAVSGSGGLTKTGAGTVVLSASNTYSGPTQVTKGTLTAGNISAFGSNSAVTMADDATAALSLGGYRVAIGSLAGGGSAGGNVVLGASGFLTAGSNNSTTTYAGVISGGAPLALTDSSASTTNLRTATAIGSNAISGIDKVGTGNWTLSGLNTYQGLTRVTGGTLTAGVGSNGALTASALGNASNVVVWNSAVLNLNNFSTEIGLLRMETGTSSLTLGTATLTVNTFATNEEGDTRSTRFNGKISGTGGNLVVKGSGTLFFISVGNGASAYTGTTTIEKNARVQIGSSSANANEAFKGSGEFINNGLITYIETGYSRVFANKISGEGKVAINFSGNITATLSGANTYTGGTTVSGATLKAGSSSAFGANAPMTVSAGATLDLGGNSNSIGSLDGGGIITNTGASATLTVTSSTNTTFSGVIKDGSASNLLSLTKAGAGTLTLSGTNTFTGVTTLTAGTLSVATINAGGVAGNLGQASADAGNLVLNGGTLQYTATGTTASTNRAFTLMPGTMSTIEVTSASSVLTMSGASASTTGSLTKSGSGTLMLSGANSFSGTTNITGGSLILANPLALQYSTLNLTNSGFSFGGLTEATLGGLSGSSALSLTNSATPSAGVVLRVGNNDSNTHYAGILSGVAGSLMKVGAGTFMLSGDNTYGGGTTISGGTLQVGSGGSTGALGSGWVTNHSSLIFNRTANTTIANVVSGSGSVLATITGNLTLSAGASVSSTANDIVLSASGNFINNAGNTALSATGNGKRWVIYSADPSSNTFNGLISGSKALWGSTYLSLPPISVSAGNRYVFSVSGGTVTASTTAASKTYGDPAISLSGQISYSLTGPAFGSGNSYGVYASNESNDSMSTIPSIASSGNTLAAGVGTYAYTFATLGVASGGFSYTSLNNGSFTVAPKTVTYVGSTTNVTYNASPQSANNTYHLTGVISSDLSNVSLSAFTAARGTNAGTYLDTVSNLSGTASGNYQLASSGNTLGSLVIAAKPLTYIGSTTNVVYNASPQSANNTYQLTGVIASDVGNVSLSASTAASGTDAGTYLDTVTNLSGTASGNYQLASGGNKLGSLVIAAKPLTYIGSTTNVTYNASPQSANNTYQLTGVIASDVGNVSLSVSTAASGRNAGTYLDTVTNLSGTASGNYQLASGGNTLGSLVIAAKPLTYIGSTTNVTYNASPQSANNTYQLTGVIASDVGNVILSASTSASGTNVGTYLDTVTNLSGTASGNYQLASNGNTLGSLVIAAKPLTYIGSTANVTYNASPQSANNTYQLTGVIASDVGNVSLSASTSASGTNTGTYQDTVTNLSGTASGNYQLASSGNTLGSLVIAAKPLTYIGSTTNVTYNASPQSANNTYQLTGVIASDVGNVSLSAFTAASGTNAGTYYDTVSNLSGTASGNYQLASNGNTPGSLAIAAKPLNYIGSTTNVTYNASPQSANNTYQLTGVIASDIGNVSLSAATPAIGTNAGTYLDAVTNLRGTASGNYQLASSGNTLGSLVIGAKPLTYIGSTTNVIYNASPQSANNTYQLTGVIASDLSNVSLTASASASGTNAGTYLDTVTSLSGTASRNYQLAISGNTLGSLVIAAKPLNYIGNTTNVTYNASPQSANNTYQLAGVIASDIGNVSLSASTSASGTNAGTYQDAVTSLSGTASGNYQLASSGNTLGSLVIAAKSLNYIGSTTNVTYNASPQSANNTYTLKGVIASDIGNVSLSAATPASGTNAGTYLDTLNSLSGAASGNYQLVSGGSTMGSLVIAAKTLTLSSLTANNKVYDATTTATITSYGTLIGDARSSNDNRYYAGDTVELVKSNATANFSDPNVGTGKTVTVTGLALSNSNYTLVNPTTTANITAQALNLLAITGSRRYNGTTLFTYQDFNVTGALNNEVVSLTAGSANTPSPNVGVYGNRPLSGLAISVTNGSADNYTLPTTANLTITKAPLTISATTDSRAYNGTPVSNALPNYSKLFENDTLTGLSQSFASKDAKGTGASTLNVNSGFVLNDGNDGGNYEVTRVPATGTITPAKLTVAGVTAASKVYDGTRFALLSGGGIEVLGRDSVTLVKTDAVGSFDSKDVGTAKPVTATGYALSGADAGNYSLIQPAGLLADITPKALRIVANNDTRTYDGMAYNGGNGVTYIGFVAGESQAMLAGILSYGGTSQGAVNVGTYTLQPKGLAARNYSLSLESGQLSILAAPPVVPLIAQWAQAYVPLEPKPNAVPVLASAPSIVTQGRLTIIAPPQANTVGVATLAVNQTLPAAGQSIQIPMPRELLGLNRATVNVSGLPSWLSFDPLDQVFIVRAVPFGVETIQITVQVDGKIWNLTLDFRSN